MIYIIKILWARAYGREDFNYLIWGWAYGRGDLNDLNDLNHVNPMGLGLESIGFK